MIASADDSMVSPDDACPNCGERDADMLVWLDAPHEERVERQRCKTVYAPGRPRDDR